MRRFRIGLMVGNKADDYLGSVRRGVQNTLEAQGHLLVNVVDLIPYHSIVEPALYLSCAFEVAARLDLDATIVPIGSAFNYLPSHNERAYDYLRELDPKRTIVAEREVEGYRCITKDSLPGMHACMRHLIETCGFTRIAFITGPEGSGSAHERANVYLEEMATHGLEVGEGMLRFGQYSGRCLDIIEEVLDLVPRVEAIACGSDLIARSVYRVMHQRKLVVGVDVAVTGFDDQPIVAHMDPPLTTVHMTGYEMGEVAAREAIRLCEGLDQLEYRTTSSLVVRASCGENEADGLTRERALIAGRPLDVDAIADHLVAEALPIASQATRTAFRTRVRDFFQELQSLTASEGDAPDAYSHFLRSEAIINLFGREFSSFMGIEGFLNAVTKLLEAIITEGAHDPLVAQEQMSYLHQRISRMFTDSVRDHERTVNMREYQSFHLSEDALSASDRPQTAYALMLDELHHMGVRQADLFLLHESVPDLAGETFGLPEALDYVGYLDQDRTNVFWKPHHASFSSLLETVLPRYHQSTFCIAGAVMAGNEVMGILVMDPGSLDDNGQQMAMLNTGLALKYLQMLDRERAMNQVLSANNLTLAHLSSHDELTGLLNRRGFESRLHTLATASADDLMALLYLDLDGLKRINDELGHDSGDLAIEQTAGLLAHCIPDCGLLARMGGDEFVALVPERDEDQAQKLAQEVEETFRDHNGRKELPFELSISCGLECFRFGSSPQEAMARAIARADARMYEQKRRHHLRRTS